MRRSAHRQLASSSLFNGALLGSALPQPHVAIASTAALWHVGNTAPVPIELAMAVSMRKQDALYWRVCNTAPLPVVLAMTVSMSQQNALHTL